MSRSHGGEGAFPLLKAAGRKEETQVFIGGQRRVDAGLMAQGDNGAGKTSLLRILCGLARPESGGVSWQGQPLANVDAGLMAQPQQLTMK
jgi:ABC-type transport system involved in cytochrome c biogenesis ATPase subunit